MTETILAYVRLLGGEFAADSETGVSDENLDLWFQFVEPMVSKKQFGKLYDQAIALLICHKLKLAGYGENPLGDLGTFGVGFAVNSVSEGGSSISYGAGQTSNLADDAELALTVYGLQYLQLRRLVIVPIHCSGESV